MTFRLKGITTLVSLCIIVFILAPLTLGFYLQNQYPQYISALNDNTNSYQVQLNDFHRGWFHSQAQLTITLNSGQLEHKAIKLTHDIQQGPLFLHSAPNQDQHTHFGLALIAGQAQINNHTVISHALISFNHTIKNKLRINHLSLDFIHNQSPLNKITIDNMQLSTTYNFKHHIGSTRGTITKASLYTKNTGHSDRTNSLTLNHIFIDSNFNKIDNRWMGDRTFSFKTGLALINQQKNTINNASFSTRLSQENDRIDFGLKSSINKIHTPDAVLGPLNLDIELNQLDNKTLSKIQHTLTTTPMHNNLELQAQQNQLKAQLQELIYHGATLHLNDFSITTAAGKTQLTAKIQLPQSHTHNLMLTLTFGLDAHVTLSIPQQQAQAWLSQLSISDHTTGTQNTSDMIDSLIQSHWLIKDGTMLNSSISYSKGQLIVNKHSPSLTPLLKSSPLN